MLRLYRILSYLFNLLLIIGIGISVYEFFILDYNYDIITLLVNLIIVTMLTLSVYMIIKTRSIVKLMDYNNKENTLDQEEEAISFRFKFDKATLILNIIIGCFISILAIYILVSYGIYTPLTLNEILRLTALVFFLFYGILQINYSIKVFKLIN